jgi:hypothetical protein
VDVAAGERSITVSAPQRIAHTILSTLPHRRRDGGVADIGVDLGEEIAADDHRLEFGVVDIAGDDGAAARDLGAHEFRRDEGGDFRVKAFAVGERGFRHDRAAVCGRGFSRSAT